MSKAKFKKRKLSEDEVSEIIKALEKSYRGQIVDLAKKYGVSHATISQLKHGHRRVEYVESLKDES